MRALFGAVNVYRRAFVAQPFAFEAVELAPFFGENPQRDRWLWPGDGGL